MSSIYKLSNHPWKTGLCVFLLVGIAVLSLSYWQYKEDQARIIELTRSEASKISSLLKEDIHSRFRALQRMSNRWEQNSGTSQHAFMSDALSYITDQAGYLSIEWVDKDFEVRWAATLLGKEQTIDLFIGKTERKLTIHEAAKDTKNITITKPLELAKGGAGILGYIPLKKRKKFDGFLLAIFDIEDWIFQTLLNSDQSYNKNFHIELTIGEKLAFKNDAKQISTSYTPVENKFLIEHQNFALKISPTQQYVSAQSSSLLWFILLFGLLSATFLGVTAGALIASRNAIVLQKKITSEFQKFEAQHTQLINVQSDLICRFSPEGILNFANLAYANFAGEKATNLIGTSILENVPLEEHEVIISDFYSLNPENPSSTMINQKQNATGGIRLYEWINHGYFTEEGIVEEVLSIGRDVTDIHESRQKAEAANLAKSEFLASMSHEIRTPIAGVIGMTDLLLDTQLSSQQLDWMTSIKTSSENLLKILNEILDQSKLEAGKLDIYPIDFDLKALIKDTTELFIPAIATKGLDFELVEDKNLPQNIHADSLRIGQILSNFLSNALKFTAVGKITVTVELQQIGDSQMLFISVKDSGIGLSPEGQENLFSSFNQADASTSREYGGTGLGLSISKQLVQLMDGKIGMESFEGEGSTFWVSIPFLSVQKTIAPNIKRTAPDKWIASRVLRILVAEDNAINQQIIGAVLTKLGHDVAFADNGKAALKSMNDENYDLILMDIRMPVMDGLEATSRIRALNSDKANIIIIALTADISSGYIEQFMAVGMNDVCTKPIDLPVLLKSINKHLGEEIHTPISGIYRHENEQETLQIDTDKKTENGDNFSQILEHAAKLMDQKSELDSEDTSPCEMAIQLGDDFLPLKVAYENDVVEKCNELRLALNELGKKPNDNDLKKQIKNMTHNIKGSGQSFGYNLITTIATRADKHIANTEKLSEEDMYILDCLSDALRFVATKKISGNGGKVGHLLLSALPEQQTSK